MIYSSKYMAVLWARFVIFASIVLLFYFSLPVFGADIWMASVTLGNGSGAQSNNAEAWNNSPVLNPGDIIHVVGIITNNNQYNQQLYINYSGTQASPITVHFEPGSGMQLSNGVMIYMQSPNYYSTGAILSNIVIDGGSNGFLTDTQAGSLLLSNNAVNMIYANGVSNLTVKNLGFFNQYVHVGTNDLVQGQGSIAGALYSPLLYGSNYFLSDNFSNIQWGIELSTNSAYLLVSNCTFNYYDHGVVPGGTNVFIVNSHFGITSNWDTYNNTFHHDCIHYYAGTNGMQSFVIAGNSFIGPFGYSITAAIFLENNSNNTPPAYSPPNALFYNNLFIEGANDTPSDGMIFCAGPNAHIYNNTFIGNGAPSSNSSAIFTNANGCIMANNLITGFGVFTHPTTTNQASFFNNLYANNPTGGGNGTWDIGSSYYTNFLTWSNLVNDAGSIYLSSGYVVNADGTLNSNSPAVNTGTNLSKYFTTDYLGNTRSAWDIGAIAYTSSGGEYSPAVLFYAH